MTYETAIIKISKLKRLLIITYQYKKIIYINSIAVNRQHKNGTTINLQRQLSKQRIKIEELIHKFEWQLFELECYIEQYENVNLCEK